MTIFEAAQLSHVTWTHNGMTLDVKEIMFKRDTIWFITKNELLVFYFNARDLGVKVKPTLRTVEQMTAEEAEKYLSFVFESSVKVIKIDEEGILFDGDKFEGLYEFDELTEVSLKSEAFTYLAANGFDVWGYIKKGIATKSNA